MKVKTCFIKKKTEISAKKSESWTSSALAKANKILLITKANTKN